MNGINTNVNTVQRQTDEPALRKEIKELEDFNRYLIKELTAAYHTITTVLEIEAQMNKHHANWTHSDRRAVAELAIKICQQRLNRLPVPLTKEAIATHVSDTF